MIKGMRNAAEVLGHAADARSYTEEMAALKQAFNSHFWNGKGVPRSGVQKATDDRVHALAVVSGWPIGQISGYPERISFAGEREPLYGKIRFSKP